MSLKNTHSREQLQLYRESSQNDQGRINKSNRYKLTQAFYPVTDGVFSTLNSVGCPVQSKKEEKKSALYNKVYIEYGSSFQKAKRAYLRSLEVDSNNSAKDEDYFNQNSNRSDVREEEFQRRIRRAIKAKFLSMQPEPEIKYDLLNCSFPERTAYILKKGCVCWYSFCGFRNICEFCLFKENEKKVNNIKNRFHSAQIKRRNALRTFFKDSLNDNKRKKSISHTAFTSSTNR